MRSGSSVHSVVSANGPDSQRFSLHDAARRRFVVNVAANVCYAVSNTALMVWYVPFLVHHLGVAPYGMISLANSVALFAVILSSSLDVAIGRFLAIDLNQKNVTRANQTFNTALALSTLVCGSLAIPAGLVSYLFPALFNVPTGLETATRFLFASVALTTLLSILSGPFGAASVITHRFDLRGAVRLVTSLTRAGIVVLCFSVWPASLWYVSLGFFVSAWVSFIGDIVLWSRLTPTLRVDPRSVRRPQAGGFVALASWSTVNQVGVLLLMQVDLLIVNAMFGAEMTGRYASVLLFPALIHTMAESVATVLSPAIMARYAIGDIDGMRQLASRSAKMLGVALALPVGLLCGLGGPLLDLWLGAKFVALDTVLILLCGHLTWNIATRPLLYVLTAYNRVKVQGVATLAFGAANLGLAVALAKWSGWGVAGVAAAAAIVWTVKNVGLLSGYCAVLMRLRWWAFYPPLAAGALGTLGVALAGKLVSRLWWPHSWFELGIAATAISLAYCILALLVGLNRSDRELLRSLVFRSFHA